MGLRAPAQNRGGQDARAPRQAAPAGRLLMDYRVFDCVSEVDGAIHHCYFVYIQTAISLRHSDTVDVRFMVNGKRITVALPHVAFVEYAGLAGEVLTDEAAISIAARCLKEALEKGASVEDLTMPVERVLEMARRGPAGNLPGDAAETTPDLNPPGRAAGGRHVDGVG